MNKEQKWREHVKGQSQSGLSQQAYCRRYGLKSSSFSYWLKKLREEEKDGFVEIGSSAPLELLIGEIIVRVPPGFNADELRRVTEALLC